MNRRGIRALVRRDLAIATGSKAIVLPTVLVPLVLLVALPALAGFTPRVVDAATAGDLDALIALLPSSTRAGLPSDPGLQAAVIVVRYLLSPLVLIVPVMIAAVLAADGIAGEKERGTLEGLLLTPLSDREIATGKLLAATLPAIAIGVGGAVVYAITANLAVGTQVGAPVLPTVEFTVMSLWVGPTFAAASLGAVSLVSVRVDTTQEAFQVGGIVVIPVVVLLISQASGALLLSTWLLVAVGGLALLVAFGLLAASGRALSRPRLGERLG